MLKRFGLLIIAVASLGLMSSCFLDPDEPTVKPDPVVVQDYKDLTARWHPLNNLELAWNDRSASRYDELLDDNFTFFFSLGDVGNNGIPEQWDRATETIAVGNMFDPNYAGANRITDIVFNLAFDPENPNGSISWTAVQPGPGPYDGETWYQTILNYDFTIQADPDLTFITQGNSKAQYTVRKDPTDNKWRIIELRDLGSS